MSRGSFGNGLREALFQRCQPLTALGISLIGLGERNVGGGDHPDLLAHVIEGQHFVEEEQASIGNSKLIFGVVGQALDLAHRIVSKESDGAGGERRQSRDARRLMSAERFAQNMENVAFNARGAPSLR